MKITWLGTASILLESGDTKILFDPYLKSFNPKLPTFPLDDIANVKSIFITHPHFDHFADMPIILEHTNCSVFVCKRGIETSHKQNFSSENLKRISANETITIGDITITPLQGLHVQFDKMEAFRVLLRAFRGKFFRALKIRTLNKAFSIANEDIFCYHVKADGKNVLLMGSAGLMPGLSYPQNCDLLILPYQGRSDMCAYCLNLVKNLSPQKILLDHFDDAFPPITETMDTNAFVKACSIPVIVPVECNSIFV